MPARGKGARSSPPKRPGATGRKAGSGLPRTNVSVSSLPSDPASDLDRLISEDTAPEVVHVLQALASDPLAPASARASAARTLAEIEGRIGRHAPAPERPTQDVALLSRDELVAELGRLRAACAALTQP